MGGFAKAPASSSSAAGGSGGRGKKGAAAAGGKEVFKFVEEGKYVKIADMMRAKQLMGSKREPPSPLYACASFVVLLLFPFSLLPSAFRSFHVLFCYVCFCFL